MVTRKTPKNKDGLILIDNDKVGNYLQEKGFVLKYIDNDYYYFEDTKELKELLNGGDIFGKEN